MYVFMYMCIFSGDFSGLRHFKKRKGYHMVESWIMHCLWMVVLWLTGVVRAGAVNVARNLGSDSSLPKLRELKGIRDASLIDQLH